MKFINYLEKVSGVDIMGLFSLCVFVFCSNAYLRLNQKERFQ
jgi:hypothetical protein